MNIKILGSGCKKCIALGDNAQVAAQEIGVEFDIEKVTDVVAIAGYGIMSTPGLVVNDKVVSSGRVLTPAQIKEILLAA